MPSIVALDIETTGLDPNTDSIIEIGVVRFSQRRIEDEWSGLINPGRHIPEFISGLTGISDEMVRQAPRIRDVLPELVNFIGDSPILGHNIRFDISFFQKFGLFAANPRIDTYEIASALLPSAGRYNLRALGLLLGIPQPATHRALDDARVSQGIFNRMESLARECSLELLAELVRLGEPLAWEGLWPFQQALRARSKETIEARRAKRQAAGPLFEPVEEKRHPPLRAVETPVPLDPEETAALLEYGGLFSQHFDGYENRPEQVEMLKAVANALSLGQHLMVEAGTGVGKSYAYLTPAALFALANNTRVVISTNTINLQDQLIKKDIPDLRDALGIDLRAAVLKGRSNYLCPRRLDYIRRHGPRTPEEMRVLGKVLVWLDSGGSGDRTEINLTGPVERDVWTHISAEDDGCTTETCVDRMGGACPFFQARQSAQNSHLLVVNHALLLTDVATGNRVLPEYQYLIVDEAHHLEAATTGALSLRFTQHDLERLMREIGGSSSGALGYMAGNIADALRPSDLAAINQKIDRATDLTFRLQNQGQAFFLALQEFIDLQREGKAPSTYAYQERVLPHTRTQPGWEEIELAWDASGETARLLLTLLGELQKDAAQLFAEGLEELEDTVGSLANIFRRLAEAEASITSLVFEPRENQVYWVEVNPNGSTISVNAAPLRVGPMVEQFIWHEKTCAILTSATLTTRNEFDYIRNTLNADEAGELALGSPFDYENAALLFIANDIAEPNNPEYNRQVEQSLVHLCKVTGGRTLALFTSYAQLKRTAKAIASPLAANDIIVYEQGEGASPNTLLETFKSSERAVLLGTRSFWEGVDIPGEALSVVVIVKLPFDVPSDPLIAARSETFEDPFNEYQLPEAILKFRQGFGRLIRSQSDRGVVVILDRRVLTKAYGRYFIESLPPCTKRVGPLAELPRAASRWLGLG
ncbi:MAG: hypothetical protein FJZ96_06315 [Chloroflexi bacterium]|nr:hypothetical protein [Chloroflexota bacterium]